MESRCEGNKWKVGNVCNVGNTWKVDTKVAYK